MCQPRRVSPSRRTRGDSPLLLLMEIEATSIFVNEKVGCHTIHHIEQTSPSKSPKVGGSPGGTGGKTNIRTRVNALVIKRQESDILIGSETDQIKSSALQTHEKLSTGSYSWIAVSAGYHSPRNTISPRTSKAKMTHPFGTPP